MTFPVLLDDMPSPVLSAYPKPTVIAKKLEAIVRFGRVNSRLKDYFDLWILLVTVDADRADVTLVIAATFARQSCPCSPWPAMLSTNVRVGEACDFTTICDTAKVCEGGAGLHPLRGAEGGAKVAVCEGNSQGTQPKDRASSVSPRYLTEGQKVQQYRRHGSRLCRRQFRVCRGGVGGRRGAAARCAHGYRTDPPHALTGIHGNP